MKVVVVTMVELVMGLAGDGGDEEEEEGDGEAAGGGRKPQARAVVAVVAIRTMEHPSTLTRQRG